MDEDKWTDQLIEKNAPVECECPGVSEDDHECPAMTKEEIGAIRGDEAYNLAHEK